MNELILPYCERVNLGFEPLNTLSNATYCFVALWWLKRSEPELRRRVEAALVALIGILSGLYHAWPGSMTQALDVAGIALFVGVALYRMVARTTSGHLRAGLALGIWLASSAVAAAVSAATPALLNGSVIYLPTLAALTLLYLHTGNSRPGASPMHPAHPAPLPRHKLGAALALFTLALILRTLDSTLCAALPVGTHALWHVLTALAIGVILQALHARAVLPR